MSNHVQIDSMLTRTPGVNGGRLCIQGTRVSVNQIATLYKRGESAEEIADNFPQVSLGQVHSALAYYHTHTAEVESELAKEDAEFRRLQADWMEQNQKL